MKIDGLSRVSDEVYVSDQPVTRISYSDIEKLKNIANSNKRKRVRLNAHENIGNSLHEMLIVHKFKAYCPPHKHLNKSESFHMIEGHLKIILFHDDGTQRETIEMGGTDPQAHFFYRLSEPIFHMVIPLTEFVVFHEVTNGPFLKNESVIAPWAPPDDLNINAQQLYIAEELAKQKS